MRAAPDIGSEEKRWPAAGEEEGGQEQGAALLLPLAAVEELCPWCSYDG